MFFLSQSENPFQYMREFNSLWYILFGAVVVCAILLFILRPIHKLYTDRKTRAIIEESGVADDLEEPPPAGKTGKEGGADDE